MRFRSRPGLSFNPAVPGRIGDSVQEDPVTKTASTPCPPGRGGAATTAARPHAGRLATFLRAAALATAGLAAAAAALLPAGCRNTRSGRPDVLFIVIDTLRADRCSLHGYTRPTTPVLDAFAKQAVTYDDAWAQGSWTVPSHVALFTGQNLHRVDWMQGADTELVGSVTLAERLSAAGWETGAFTANPWVGPSTGLHRGFRTFDQRPPLGIGFASAEVVFGRAREWIRHRSEDPRPWFAYVNVMEPHAPYDPPPEESARFLSAGHRPADIAEARTLHSGNRLLFASLRGIGLPHSLEKEIGRAHV
jgi:arylsulfatase A-like enzyme